MLKTDEIVRPRLLFLVTEDWYFWSHRLDLARKARDAGFEVLVATQVQNHGRRIKDEGFRVLPISLQRRNRNPLRELLALLELISLYRQTRPHIVHHVAIKPLIYGSLAAWITQTPVVINAFAGLGYTFIEDSRRTRFLRSLIRYALRWTLELSSSRVILQNEEDRHHLIRAGILRRTQIIIIPGVGVNIEEFVSRPENNGKPLIILASRMLWDKGIKEFVRAAIILKERGIPARFVLVGEPDYHNPATVEEEHLIRWRDAGIVEWWGWQEDMPQVLGESHVVVLPSYREGLPKVLLEASACARPIVATDVPGCREVVRHGENGLLVPARNPEALADAIATLIENPRLRRQMGNRAREIVVNKFSSEKIGEETLAVYRHLLGEAGPKSSLSTRR